MSLGLGEKSTMDLSTPLRIYQWVNLVALLRVTGDHVVFAG